MSQKSVDRETRQPESRPAHDGRDVVGFEDPHALVTVADARGRGAARVRLAPSLAVDDGAPSTTELQGWDRPGRLIGDRLEAEESLERARAQASAGERRAAAGKRRSHLQEALARNEGNSPEPVTMKSQADSKLEAARGAYRALPTSERVTQAFGGRGRLEVGVLLAAVFDAVTLARPLEASGLAQQPLSGFRSPPPRERSGSRSTCWAGWPARSRCRCARSASVWRSAPSRSSARP